MHWSVSQEKYCGGFSSVDPPLSIPNREVKRTYADGTDRPVGRVGSRRSSKARSRKRPGLFVSFGNRRTAAIPSRSPPNPLSGGLVAASCSEQLHQQPKNGAYRQLFRGAAPKVPRRRRTPGFAALRGGRRCCVLLCVVVCCWGVVGRSL